MICLVDFLILNVADTKITLCVECDLSAFKSEVVLMGPWMISLCKFILVIKAHSVRDGILEILGSLSIFLHELEFSSQTIIFSITFLFIPKIDPDSLELCDVKILNLTWYLPWSKWALSLLDKLWFPCLCNS